MKTLQDTQVSSFIVTHVPDGLWIRNNFCFDDLSQKCHLGRRSMTTLESPWLSSIQYNISSHSGQLLLKKYCRKSALTACSPRFSQSGTWGSTTTSVQQFSYDSRPGSWFQVFIIDYMDTVSLWTLVIFVFLQGKMMISLDIRTQVPHQRKNLKTNIYWVLLFFSLYGQSLYNFDLGCTGAFWL